MDNAGVEADNAGVEAQNRSVEGLSVEKTVEDSQGFPRIRTKTSRIRSTAPTLSRNIYSNPEPDTHNFPQK